MIARNTLLTEMTDDVAAASLRNNYQQSLALSLAERRSVRDLPDYPLLMRALEARGLLDRPLEALPSDDELLERARAGRGLHRPELAVLLSYAKIALSQDLLASNVPDEPLLESWLSAYFPERLRTRFAGDIKKHILRREIIATGLTNAIVNRGGPVHGAADDRRDRARQGRRRARLHGGARGVRAAAAVAAHRCAGRQARRRRAAVALRGDAGAGAHRDAVVPARRQGDRRPRRHHRPPQRGAGRAEARHRGRAAGAAQGADRRASSSASSEAACRPTWPPMSPGWRRSALRRPSPRSPPRRATRSCASPACSSRWASISASATWPPRRRRSARSTPTTGWRSAMPSMSWRRRRRPSRAMPSPATADSASVDRAVAGALRRAPAPGRGDAGRRAGPHAAHHRPAVGGGRAAQRAGGSGRSLSITQHGPINRVLPDPRPAKACLLVSPRGSLVPDRHDGAAGDRQPGGEHLLDQQGQRGAPGAAPAMLGRGDEQVDVPGADRQVVGLLLAPQADLDRMARSRSGRRRSR